MSKTLNPIQARRYGVSGPWVAVLHGGPGAPGYMAPVAESLASNFRVLEPLQRLSGATPLTVAQHIADMRECLAIHCGDTKPAIVGASWGAMLALAYAAEYPAHCGPIVLVGCGTFDLESRAEFKRILNQRLAGERQARIDALATQIADPDQRLAAKAAIVDETYQGEPAEPVDSIITIDAQGNRESWDDMLRLQADGTYPAAFANIRSPVLMLHGGHDPHPGPMIRDSLIPHIPRLEYQEIPGCGHDPWREPRAKPLFYAKLNAKLNQWLNASMG